MNNDANKATGSYQGSERYLQFSLGPEEYAIPLPMVREVIAMPEITPVPYTPQHFLGIMNLRGQVISVIDLRLKLGIKATSTAETAVIICDLGPVCIGAIVSSINSVLTLAGAEVQPRPEIQSTRNVDYIIGVVRQEDKLVLLLDITKTLDVSDHATAQKAATQNKAA